MLEELDLRKAGRFNLAKSVLNEHAGHLGFLFKFSRWTFKDRPSIVNIFLREEGPVSVISLTKKWKPEYGGILHFMNDDKTKIIESYVPEFNTFMLFEVPEEGIPHYVSHIVPYIKEERYSITGWFS